jgi:hypothetical protein
MEPRMTRKRCRRKYIPAMLTAAQVRDLDIARGLGTEALLMQWAGAVATWGHVARMRGEGVPEMAEQADVVASMRERFARTGRVGFSGLEYQTARRGVAVMNALAEVTDLATAKRAADLAELDLTHASTAYFQP